MDKATQTKTWKDVMIAAVIDDVANRKYAYRDAFCPHKHYHEIVQPNARYYGSDNWFPFGAGDYVYFCEYLVKTPNSSYSGFWVNLVCEKVGPNTICATKRI